MSFDNDDEEQGGFYQYSRQCDFLFDSAQNVMIDSQIMFQQPFEEDCNPAKKRKINDQFCLQRFSLVETSEQRKCRLDKKREDKKFKLDKNRTILKEQSEKSTTVTEQTSSQQEGGFNKDESRKIRNRNSAQLSRDKKKNFMSNVVELNNKFQDELDQKNLEINQYLCQIDTLNYKIQALDDMRYSNLQIIFENRKIIEMSNQNEDPNQEVNSQNQTFIRVQNTYSSRHLKTYGLLSLFVIVTMLGCLSTVQQEGSPVSLIQIRQPKDQNKIESYFNNGKIDQNANNYDYVNLENLDYEPFQASEKFMEVSTMDQLRNLKTFAITEEDSSYHIRVNFQNIPTETDQQLNLAKSIEKTLLFNCTVSEDKCDTLIRVMNSRDLTDIHSIRPLNSHHNNQIKKIQDNSFKEYLHGQQITILQVFEKNNSYVLNTVKCIVDETSSLQFDSEFIDKLTI